MNLLQHLQLVPDSNNVNFKNPVPQNFHFLQPLIHYLLKNANSKVLQKLHKCCKKLFIYGKIALCKNLAICSSIEKSYYCHESETLYLSPRDSNANWLSKIFIYGTFKFINQSQTPLALSAFMTKNLYMMDAETVYAESQDITEDEFKFLLSEKTKFFILKNCRVQHRYHLYGYVKIFPNLIKAEFEGSCHNCLTTCSSRWRRNDFSGEFICGACWLFWNLNEYNYEKYVKKYPKYSWKRISHI